MSNFRFGKIGRQLTLSLISACLIGASGCGGSNDVISPRAGKLMGGRIVEKTDSNGNILKTVPLASDISGIMYRSGKRVGITDRDGLFYYKPGETIEFSIDGIIIGKLEASTTETGYAYTKKDAGNSGYKYYIPTSSTDEDRILLVSARDIAAGWDGDFSDPRVLNLLGFLEALDSDKNPSNGIEISSAVSGMIKTICTSRGIAGFDFSDSTQARAVTGELNAAGQGVYEIPEDGFKINEALYATYAKYKAMPIALISIGDGLMAGAQSGLYNIHEATQNRGVARILGDLLYDAGDLVTWQSPKLSMNSARVLARMSEVATDGSSVINIPSNVAAPAATCRDIVSKYTGSGDAVLDQLLKPVTEPAHLDAPATQLDAAIYSALQTSNRGRLKIFTVWAGSQDVYANILAAHGFNLDNVTQGLDDPETVKANLSTVISTIREKIPGARIFIGTVPDPDTLAVSFSLEDLVVMVSNSRLNAIASPPLSGLEAGSRVGLYAFMNKIAPRLVPGSSVESINTALASLSSAEILSAAEIGELQARTDAVNTYIRSLADGESVVLVDTNGLFRDFKNRKFAWLDFKYLIRVPDAGIGDTALSADYFTSRWGDGLFSSDGFYPSHTGNALIANSFFSAMAEAGLGFEPEKMQKEAVLSVNHDKNYWLLNIEEAWKIDPYRDFDGDGFPGGPGLMPPTDAPLNYIPVADPEFKTVEDCDDAKTDANKTNLLPKAVTGLECSY